jgi:ribonuclease III
MNDSDQALKDFERNLGIVFIDRALLKTAFTHRSYINESRLGGEHNERLEFLGDAVLEIVVTDYLFREYDKAPEGELTAYRAALVNATTLSSAAELLGMNNCLLLSKGEAKDTGRARSTILANAFEAFVGALYLDQGYDAAKDFIAAHLLPRAHAIITSGSWKDAKSAFQEVAQAKFSTTPRYELVSAEGPDHDKHFVIALYVGTNEVARGEGKSKQEAEQDAATRALENGV